MSDLWGFPHPLQPLTDLWDQQLIDVSIGITSRSFLAFTSVYRVSATSNDNLFYTARWLGRLIAWLSIQESDRHVWPLIFGCPCRFADSNLIAAREEFKELSSLLPRERTSPLQHILRLKGIWHITGNYKRLNVCAIMDRYPLLVFYQIPSLRRTYQRRCQDGFWTLWVYSVFTGSTEGGTISSAECRKSSSGSAFRISLFWLPLKTVGNLLRLFHLRHTKSSWRALLVDASHRISPLHGDVSQHPSVI